MRYKNLFNPFWKYNFFILLKQNFEDSHLTDVKHTSISSAYPSNSPTIKRDLLQISIIELFFCGTAAQLGPTPPLS
jgi:hypothetical protein